MLTEEEKAGFVKAVAGVQHTAYTHLSSNRSRTYAIGFISNLQRSVDQVVQAAIAQGEQFDCKPGCSHCCNVRVETSAPEIFQIVTELKKQSAESLEDLRQRLCQHVAVVSGSSVADHRASCPFLQENLCSIYAVRPAVCRKMHSYDMEKCNLLGSSIPENLDILLKVEALIKGTANAYHQIKLSASVHEIGQAILLALSDHTAEQRWYAGEKVFDEVV
jgi:Fe-S-cluster containining protein